MARGPGIAAAERDNVFTPFQRLGDTDNTPGGDRKFVLSLTARSPATRVRP
jgi:hypothetical protein